MCFFHDLASLLQSLILGYISEISGHFIRLARDNTGHFNRSVNSGSPYAAMPFFAGLIKTGISFPVGVAMACSWGLLSVGRIPFEAAVMEENSL